MTPDPLGAWTARVLISLPPLTGHHLVEVISLVSPDGAGVIRLDLDSWYFRAD